MSYLADCLARAATPRCWMKTRVEAIKTAPDGARRWLRDLGKNDFEHAEAVEEYVGKILLESGVQLSAEESYLLLHAIYTHDVGYRRDARDHARASHDAILDGPDAFFIHDEGVANAVAWIVLGHGPDGTSQVPADFPVDLLGRTLEFDLRFLSSLLMLADEMDQGYLRVLNRAGQEQSHRRTVYHVEIGPQIVKLKTKPYSRQQWEELRQTTAHVQQRLDTVAPILGARGVRIERVDLYPTVWAEESLHEETHAQSCRTVGGESRREVLFLLDATVLGADVLGRVRAEFASVTTVSVAAAHGPVYPVPVEHPYSTVIWTLGEDFAEPITGSIVQTVLRNTADGGGLVLFPFVAWSASQGINEQVEDALPVAFGGMWWEARTQRLSLMEAHTITRGLEPFVIENTYEYLMPKPGAKCLISDSEGHPFLVVGTYGRGRVAYVNVCSHVCFEDRTLVSPWQQARAVGEVIARTVAWASETGPVLNSPPLSGPDPRWGRYPRR